MAWKLKHGTGITTQKKCVKKNMLWAKTKSNHTSKWKMFALVCLLWLTASMVWASRNWTICHCSTLKQNALEWQTEMARWLVFSIQTTTHAHRNVVVHGWQTSVNNISTKRAKMYVQWLSTSVTSQNQQLLLHRCSHWMKQKQCSTNLVTAYTVCWQKLTTCQWAVLTYHATS